MRRFLWHWNAIVILLAACSDSTAAPGFDVAVSLRDQLGSQPPCGWWWTAIASDSGQGSVRIVTYDVSIGSQSRSGDFTEYTVVAVPALGTVLSAGSYQYAWHVSASPDFQKSGGGTVSCP